MNNTFQIQRSTIAAALIFVSFFMPWINISFATVSGWEIATTAISPGMLGTYVSGLTRILLALLLLIPISSAFVLWKQYKPGGAFEHYEKRAKLAPAILTVLALVAFVIKYKLATDIEMPAGYEELSKYGIRMPEIKTPGVTDIMGVGVWMGLISSLILAALTLNKIKDQAVLKPQSNSSDSSNSSNL